MENTRKQTAHIAPFGLRMQPELRSALEASAKLNGRSMNAEIVDRLNKSLEAQSSEDESFERMAKALERAISTLSQRDLEEIIKKRST